MAERFERVVGNIYRGGMPSWKDLQSLYQQYGIRKIISLDANTGQSVSGMIKTMNAKLPSSARIQHQILALSGSETSMNSSINYIGNNISEIFGGGFPIYVHCLHGRDRTGFVIALYRVFVQNWDCEKAISEAKGKGFGEGLSPQTENFYKKVICQLTKEVDIKGKGEDINTSDDMVQEMRDTFLVGEVPPAFMPQQSWAPRGDLRHEIYDPTNPIERQNFRMQELSEFANVPQVGTHDNYSGMYGAGPIDMGGGFLQL